MWYGDTNRNRIIIHSSNSYPPCSTMYSCMLKLRNCTIPPKSRSPNTILRICLSLHDLGHQMLISMYYISWSTITCMTILKLLCFGSFIEWLGHVELSNNNCTTITWYFLNCLKSFFHFLQCDWPSQMVCRVPIDGCHKLAKELRNCGPSTPKALPRNLLSYCGISFFCMSSHIMCTTSWKSSCSNPLSVCCHLLHRRQSGSTNEWMIMAWCTNWWIDFDMVAFV